MFSESLPDIKQCGRNLFVPATLDFGSKFRVHGPRGHIPTHARHRCSEADQRHFKFTPQVHDLVDWHLGEVRQEPSQTSDSADLALAVPADGLTSQLC
jgi:hypothetical protein